MNWVRSFIRATVSRWSRYLWLLHSWKTIPKPVTWLSWEMYKPHLWNNNTSETFPLGLGHLWSGRQFADLPKNGSGTREFKWDMDMEWNFSGYLYKYKISVYRNKRKRERENSVTYEPPTCNSSILLEKVPKRKKDWSILRVCQSQFKKKNMKKGNPFPYNFP